MQSLLLDGCVVYLLGLEGLAGVAGAVWKCVWCVVGQGGLVWFRVGCVLLDTIAGEGHGSNGRGWLEITMC